MKIFTAIRKFFYLTPDDLGMKANTLKGIEEGMKPGPVDPDRLPVNFAKNMSEIFSD